MPRACTICAHPERKKIDASIADKIPFLQIATKYGLNQRTVNTHGKNHVQPFIDQVEKAVQAVVMERVLAYRDQVNLPLPEKSKFVEDKLWASLDEAETIVEQMAVVREIQKQQAEQAKLAGAYQQDAKNKTDIERVAASYRHFCEMFPKASESDRSTWLDIYARESGLDRLAIMKQVREQVQEVSEVVQ